MLIASVTGPNGEIDRNKFRAYMNRPRVSDTIETPVAATPLITSPHRWSEAFFEGQAWKVHSYEKELSREVLTVAEERGLIGVISYLFQLLCWQVAPNSWKIAKPEWEIVHITKQIIEEYNSPAGTKKVSKEAIEFFAEKADPNDSIAHFAESIQKATLNSAGRKKFDDKQAKLKRLREQLERAKRNGDLTNIEKLQTALGKSIEEVGRGFSNDDFRPEPMYRLVTHVEDGKQTSTQLQIWSKSDIKPGYPAMMRTMIHKFNPIETVDTSIAERNGEYTFNPNLLNDDSALVQLTAGAPVWFQLDRFKDALSYLAGKDLSKYLLIAFDNYFPTGMATLKRIEGNEGHLSGLSLKLGKLKLLPYNLQGKTVKGFVDTTLLPAIYDIMHLNAQVSLSSEIQKDGTVVLHFLDRKKAQKEVKKVLSEGIDYYRFEQNKEEIRQEWLSANRINQTFIQDLVKALPPSMGEVDPFMPEALEKLFHLLEPHDTLRVKTLSKSGKVIGFEIEMIQVKPGNEASFNRFKQEHERVMQGHFPRSMVRFYRKESGHYAILVHTPSEEEFVNKLFEKPKPQDRAARPEHSIAQDAPPRES